MKGYQMASGLGLANSRTGECRNKTGRKKRVQLMALHWSFAVDSASNRNECQGSSLRGKSGQWLGLSTLPPSCAGCLSVNHLEPYLGLYRDSFTFISIISSSFQSTHFQTVTP